MKTLNVLSPAVDGDFVDGVGIFTLIHRHGCGEMYESFSHSYPLLYSLIGGKGEGERLSNPCIHVKLIPRHDRITGWLIFCSINTYVGFI